VSTPPPEILQFFAHDHLPPHLAEVSRPFAELANTICETLPGNAERTVALRKLLEAKDAAVRAKVYKPPPKAPAPSPALVATPDPRPPLVEIGDGILGRPSGCPETPFGAVYTAINRGAIRADRAVGVWQKGEPPSPLEASRRELLVELDERGSWRWLGPLRDPVFDGEKAQLDLERMRP
jgi:hypothetical protein